jgi:membrane protein DedA with SNARE-associated domain
VNRWFPRLKGIGKTFGSMQFNWKRWILKEHTTQFIWLIGITVLLLLDYPELTGHDKSLRNTWLIAILGVLSLTYGLIRYLKKTGKFRNKPPGTRYRPVFPSFVKQ